MHICIIGNGMYVTGRGTPGLGTIMPAIYHFQKQYGSIEEVHLIGQRVEGVKEAREKVSTLEDRTGVQIPVRYYPKKTENSDYKNDLNEVKNKACAIVCVPDHLHYEVTKACLERGLHTLVVKPLTPTLAEGIDLVRIADENQVYGMVEFHKRWDRQNRILKEMYQSGQIGDPLYTWTEYSQRKSIPSKVFRNWVEQTNIFQYLGVHYVDIVRFVTWATPTKVMATGQMGWLKEQGIDVHDAIQSNIEWALPSGRTFMQTLLVNWIDPETSSSMSDQRIKFVGTKGRFEGDQKERGIRTLIDGTNLEEPNPDFCYPYQSQDGRWQWEGYGIESVVTFLTDVSDLNDKKVTLNILEKERPTFRESLFSTVIVEAVSESLQRDSDWISIKKTIRENFKS